MAIIRIEKLSPKLATKVDEFARMPENMEVLGVVPQRDDKCATVMFCDLVGSTALSEQLDPEEWRTVVRDYQTTSAAVIRRLAGKGRGEHMNNSISGIHHLGYGDPVDGTQVERLAA